MSNAVGECGGECGGVCGKYTRRFQVVCGNGFNLIFKFFFASFSFFLFLTGEVDSCGDKNVKVKEKMM